MRRIRGLGRPRRCLKGLVFGLLLSLGLLTPKVGDAADPLFVGVTTSTENSGLLAHLVEAFSTNHDLQIRAVTAGSGAVLNLGARGDVDVILVHAPDDEEAFIKAGHGIDRRAVMRNRFIVVGPKTDPAGITEERNAAAAFRAIAENGALFLSRGDESGTHRTERQLWSSAGIEPDGARREGDGTEWYRESGSGQGATLNIAANTGAYTLTDEATWATFGNPGELQPLYAKDEPALLNVYSVIRVNPDRHESLNAEGALTFVDWLTSKAGQDAISSFKVDGRSLFQPEDRLSG